MSQVLDCTVTSLQPGEEVRRDQTDQSKLINILYSFFTLTGVYFLNLFVKNIWVIVCFHDHVIMYEEDGA